MSLLNQVLQDLDDRAPEGGEPRLRLAPAAEARGPVAARGSRNRPDWWRLGIWSVVAVAVIVSAWVFTTGDRRVGHTPPPVSPQPGIPSSTPPPTAVASPPALQQSEVLEDRVAEVVPSVRTEPHGRLSDEASTGDVPSDPPLAAVASLPVPQPPEAAVVPAALTGPQDALPAEAPTDDLPLLTAASNPTAAAIAPAPVSQQIEEPEPALDDPPAAPEPRYLPLRNTGMPPPPPPRPKPAARDRTSPAGLADKSTKQPASHPLEEAREALADGELALAEYLLQIRLRSVPRDLEARELLVGLMLRGERYSAAMQQLERGLTLDPGHNTFVLIKARLLAMTGDAEDAIRVLETGPRLAAGKVERLQMLGALYQQQARFEDAVKAYRALLGLAPGDGPAWVGLAISLDGLADPAAFEAFARALTLGGLPAAAEAYARERLQQRGSAGG